MDHIEQSQDIQDIRKQIEEEARVMRKLRNLPPTWHLPTDVTPSHRRGARCKPTTPNRINLKDKILLTICCLVPVTIFYLTARLVIFILSI